MFLWCRSSLDVCAWWICYPGHFAVDSHMTYGCNEALSLMDYVATENQQTNLAGYGGLKTLKAQDLINYKFQKFN